MVRRSIITGRQRPGCRGRRGPGRLPAGSGPGCAAVERRAWPRRGGAPSMRVVAAAGHGDAGRLCRPQCQALPSRTLHLNLHFQALGLLLNPASCGSRLARSWHQSRPWQPISASGALRRPPHSRLHVESCASQFPVWSIPVPRAPSRSNFAVKVVKMIAAPVRGWALPWWASCTLSDVLLLVLFGCTTRHSYSTTHKSIQLHCHAPISCMHAGHATTCPPRPPLTAAPTKPTQHWSGRSQASLARSCLSVACGPQCWGGAGRSPRRPAALARLLPACLRRLDGGARRRGPAAPAAGARPGAAAGGRGGAGA
jgi:hypothetical protein